MQPFVPMCTMDIKEVVVSYGPTSSWTELSLMSAGNSIRATGRNQRKKPSESNSKLTLPCSILLFSVRSATDTDNNEHVSSLLQAGTTHTEGT